MQDEKYISSGTKSVSNRKSFHSPGGPESFFFWFFFFFLPKTFFFFFSFGLFRGGGGGGGGVGGGGDFFLVFVCESAEVTLSTTGRKHTARANPHRQTNLSLPEKPRRKRKQKKIRAWKHWGRIGKPKRAEMSLDLKK